MRRRRVILGAGLLLAAALLGFSPVAIPNRPESCGACHSMRPRLEAWKTGRHHRVAACTDCHVPGESPVGALLSKAGDGLRHGATQAAGRTPQFIHVRREKAFEVLQANCLRCHGDRIERAAWLRLPPLGASEVRTRPRPDTAFHADATRSCMDCHRETGHRPGA